MATTKKSVKKPTVKKSVAKKTVKKTNVKKVEHKCECTKNGVCTCKNCTCKCSGKESVKYTSMFTAYRAFWHRGFTEWAGTSSRSEYWWSWLMNVLVCMLFAILFVGAAFLDAALFTDSAPFIVSVGAAFLLYVIAAIVPAISMLTRRMHDAGLSAWFWLLYLTTFLPVVGSYIWTISVFVIALLPTKVADNPYHKFNK